MYANRLRDAGVRVDYVCFGGMLHGFIASGKLLDTAGQAVALVGQAVRQALR
jgi:acetyl esterase